jgi:hypothetical protein
MRLRKIRRTIPISKRFDFYELNYGSCDKLGSRGREWPAPPTFEILLLIFQIENREREVTGLY